MSSFLILLLLLMIVLLLFVFPVKEKRIDFDEKGEAIKVYKDEVNYLQRQQQKGFIDENEKTQLLVELDKKTALAMTAIEQRSYSYRRSFVPLVLTVVGLAAASMLYFRHYQDNGVYRWQAFNFANRGAITEGLFDKHVVENFISNTDAKTGAAYCFAMQRTLLKKYDTNPDTLANLAHCHLRLGYLQLAADAAKRGLQTKPQHSELNYLMAAVDYIANQSLSPTSVDRLSNVIKNNATHENALRLLAINSLQQGNNEQAQFFFAQLKKLLENSASDSVINESKK